MKTIRAIIMRVCERSQRLRSSKQFISLDLIFFNTLININRHIIIIIMQFDYKLYLWNILTKYI